MNIDDIIEFEEENTNLDFKKEEYRKENYDSLIKDVMSMANANTTGIKRIIIGVKHKFGKEREIIGLDSLTDQAVFENIIQDNIEPNINFRYYPYNYKGKLLGIIEINNNFDKPYMTKKQRGSLKEHETWIRKGSRQSIATRDDVIAMIESRKSSNLQNNTIIGFGKKLENSIEVRKTLIDKENLPSQIEIKRLKKLINKIDERYNKSDEQDGKSAYSGKRDLSKQIVLGEFMDSSQSIRVGYSEFNMPIYKNKKELLKKIKEVPEQYVENDEYYIYEQCSEKFNCQIYNDGSEFLEDVKIELFFDSEIFVIPEKIYEEPVSYGLLRPRVRVPNINNYPKVYCDDGNIVVEENHKKIRHKTLTNVFGDDLRILIKPNVKVKEIEVKYRIGAKNLTNHVEGNIVIKIV